MQELIDLIHGQLHYKRTSETKLYTLKGMVIQDDDLGYLCHGDIIYYDHNGSGFDSSSQVDSYKKLELLGKGGFGSVWKGKHRQNGNVVAIKYMNLSEYSKNILLTSQ